MQLSYRFHKKIFLKFIPIISFLLPPIYIVTIMVGNFVKPEQEADVLQTKVTNKFITHCNYCGGGVKQKKA